MNDATLRSFVPSVVRTLVPIVYGLLIHAGLGSLGVSQQFVSGLLATALTTGLYAAIRVGEAKLPAVGWLLGLAKQPVYVKPEAPVATPAPVAPVAPAPAAPAAPVAPVAPPTDVPPVPPVS